MSAVTPFELVPFTTRGSTLAFGVRWFMLFRLKRCETLPLLLLLPTYILFTTSTARVP
jgi:hypothetical protein